MIPISALAGVNGDVWISTSPSLPLLPVKDAVSNASTAAASSLTWNHTVSASASNLILVVSVAVGSSATCSGVTYSGASLTSLTSKNQGTETVYIFYKLNPATGANNIVASFSGSASGIGAAVSYSSVYQTTPFGTAASSSGTSGNSSNSVTTSYTSQLVLDVNYLNGSSSAVGASQTIETSNTTVAPFYFSDIGAAASSPLALSWTNAGSPTIWIEVSVALNPVPETCTDSGDHINYFTAVHQAWDSTQTFIIQYSPNGSTGWTTDASADYTVYWPVGQIVFATARTPGTNNFIRIISGSYFALSALGGAHMWSMSMKGNVKDVTPFQAAGSWTVNAATLKTATWNVDCYSQDARILNEMITSGTGKINISGGIVMCQLWTNETGGNRFQFYALPTGITQTVAAQDIDTQQVTFQSTGLVYGATSNSFTITTVIPM